MSHSGLDVASNAEGKAQAIVEAGYSRVGLYLRPDRCSLASVKELHEAGIQIFSIWEKGNPTSAKYFSEEQGKNDAAAASEFAGSIGMPTELTKPIFAAVDFDASMGDIQGPILEYFKAFHDTAKSYGYLTGVYGSGQTCSHLLGTGYVHTIWLAQSTGWTGHNPNASYAIIQGPATTVCGLDVDLDTVNTDDVCW